MIYNTVMFIGFSVAYVITSNVAYLIVSATFLILLHLNSMEEKLTKVLEQLTDKNNT